LYGLSQGKRKKGKERGRKRRRKKEEEEDLKGTHFPILHPLSFEPTLKLSLTSV
jgi:hypothetical protein